MQFISKKVLGWQIVDDPRNIFAINDPVVPAKQPFPSFLPEMAPLAWIVYKKQNFPLFQLGWLVVLAVKTITLVLLCENEADRGEREANKRSLQHHVAHHQMSGSWHQNTSIVHTVCSVQYQQHSLQEVQLWYQPNSHIADLFNI